LRQLVLVVPVVAAILAPLAGPLAALLVAGVLFSFDRLTDAPPLEEQTRPKPGL
jgi:hypothetical protein